MCSTSREQRQWRLYVNDMIEFAEKVQSYTEGMDQTTFVTDSRTYQSVVKVTRAVLRAGGRWSNAWPFQERGAALSTQPAGSGA